MYPNLGSIHQLWFFNWNEIYFTDMPKAKLIQFLLHVFEIAIN